MHGHARAPRLLAACLSNVRFFPNCSTMHDNNAERKIVKNKPDKKSAGEGGLAGRGKTNDEGSNEQTHSLISIPHSQYIYLLGPPVPTIPSAPAGTPVTTPLGRCTFEDCIAGMKQLPDQSFDLCLTDPPYHSKNPLSKSFTSNRTRVVVDYDESMSDEEYAKFCNAWLAEARRVARVVVFTPGGKNDDARVYPPQNMTIHWYRPGNKGHNQSGGWSDAEPVFVYWTKCRRFSTNFMQTTPMGPNLRGQLVHSCPRNAQWFIKIISMLKPAPVNVLDPFLGSGGCAEACEERGIPWRGFELNTAYAADITKRIAIGQEHGGERVAAEQARAKFARARGEQQLLDPFTGEQP